MSHVTERAKVNKDGWQKLCQDAFHNIVVLLIIEMCSSRKYPYYPPPPPQKGLEVPGGWGFPNTKKCKEMYEVELEFPEGWGLL